MKLEMTLEVDAEEDDTFKDLKWRIKDKFWIRSIDQLHIDRPPRIPRKLPTDETQPPYLPVYESRSYSSFVL